MKNDAGLQGVDSGLAGLRWWAWRSGFVSWMQTSWPGRARSHRIGLIFFLVLFSALVPTVFPGMAGGSASAQSQPQPQSEPQPTPHAVHLTQAEVWASTSTAWLQPPSLNELDAGDSPLLDAATHWQSVALPHTRQRDLGKGRVASGDQTSVLWYRMKLPAAALAPQGTRLYLPRWQTTGTLSVYVDGILAWQSRGDQAWSNFNYPLWIDLSGMLRAGNDAWVHMRMASKAGVGGALSTMWVGPAAELLPRWRWRTFLQTTLVGYWRGSYLMLGLFALGMAAWLRFGKHPGMQGQRTEAKAFAWFFCIALGQSLAALTFLVGDEGLDMDFVWFTWITLAAMLSSPVCTVNFLGLVQHRPRPRLSRWMLVYTVAAIVLALPTWWAGHGSVLPLLRLLLVPPALVQLYVVIANARSLRSGASLFLAAWGILAWPLSMHDVALQLHWLNIEGLYLLPYLNLGLLTLFLYMMFQRYIHALESASRARVVLTEQLAAQESELRETHERLRAAEREQTLLQERQRLMREMHDGVGSSLMTALRLVERGQTQVDVVQLLKECIDDLKISIDSLDSTDADLLALLGALRFRLGPRLSGAGIVLQWQMNELPPLPWLDAQSALHVLRIVQEVLTNIIKHSGATAITVSTGEALSPRGDGAPGVQVCVRDNGHPFSEPPSASVQPGRRGLANVRSRAQALDAHCAWLPDSGGGTVFAFWLPLTRSIENAPAVEN
ncbi:histidine kinase [Pigmentiphaga aceris]|uniref:Histidine kinase n=1 Tax=Pigmentiphaga aceris TaxID=1940612 RepID=A0A5C0B195_9BURK|nr:ATP-binding protein [Pigmentiphaga aceris]QEI08448.1 histidine kinase [Pigmentiphaga aceris]